jgi:hypothetical protein
MKKSFMTLVQGGGVSALLLGQERQPSAREWGLPGFSILRNWVLLKLTHWSLVQY